MAAAFELAPLLAIVLFIVAWGLTKCADRLARALFGTINGAIAWVPGVNRIVSKPVKAVEKKITDFLGSLVVDLEGRIGAMWHALGKLNRAMADAIVDNAQALMQIVRYLPPVSTIQSILNILHALAKHDAATQARIKGLTHDVAQGETVAQHASAQAAKAHARATAVPADVVAPGDLAGLRDRVRATEDELARLWKWTRSHSRTVVAGLALGALAHALARMKLGWLRCSKVRRLGKRACGLDEALVTDLIEDSLLIIGTFSLLEFAETMGEIAEDTARAINAFAR